MPKPTERIIMTNKCMKAKIGSISQLIPTAVMAVAGLTLLFTAAAARAEDDSSPPLPSPLCDSLQVTNTDSVAFHGYAIGVQIYRWTGTNWLFVAPAARLFAD